MLLERDRHQGCLSDFALDLLVGGDADEIEREHAARHFAACDECAARHSAFARAVVQPREVSSIRVKSPRRRVHPLAIAAPLLGLAAAIALVLVPRVDQTVTPLPDVRRGKGDEQAIAFFVKRGERVMRGSDLPALEPGDQIRFAYTSNDPTYLVIISVDGAGVASTYFPEANQPVELVGATEGLLPIATELDDTLGRETIHAFFCDGPIEPEWLRAAVVNDQGIVGPSDVCRVRSLSFVKEAAQ